MKLLFSLFLMILSKGCAIAWQPVEIYNGKRCNTAIAGDLDGDMSAEIIFCVKRTIFLSSADGKKKRVLREKEHVIHSAMADLDGDGDLDYIGGLTKVIWLECPDDIWNDEWKYHVISDELRGTHAVEAVDVDGDGKVDVIANSFKNEGKYPDSIVWFKNLGGKKWQPYPLADKNAEGGSHYFKIFDHNGKKALCAGAKGGTFKNGDYFAIYESLDSVTSPWEKTFLTKGQEGATNIFPADLDKDGKVDFVMTNGHGSGVKILRGSDGKLLDVDLQMACPHSLDVGDVDGDGDLDIVTCGYLSKELAWYENKGGMIFKKHSINKDQQAYDVRLVDIDGDGLKDILVAGRMSNNVIWYKQK